MKPETRIALAPIDRYTLIAQVFSGQEFCAGIADAQEHVFHTTQLCEYPCSIQQGLALLQRTFHCALEKNPDHIHLSGSIRYWE